MLLHVLCCGLPLLLAAGALGATGSLVGSPWLITAAFVLAAGVLVWAFRRRSARALTRGDDCCAPTTQPYDPVRDGAEQSIIVR